MKVGDTSRRGHGFKVGGRRSTGGGGGTSIKCWDLLPTGHSSEAVWPNACQHDRIDYDKIKQVNSLNKSYHSI